MKIPEHNNQHDQQQNLKIQWKFFLPKWKWHQNITENDEINKKKQQNVEDQIKKIILPVKSEAEKKTQDFKLLLFLTWVFQALIAFSINLRHKNYFSFSFEYTLTLNKVYTPTIQYTPKSNLILSTSYVCVKISYMLFV